MNENHKDNNATSKIFLTGALLTAVLLSSGATVAMASGPTNSLHSTELQQQKNIVKGKVLDPGGEPVIGASVLVKGTQKGAITDMNGDFAIEVPIGGTLEVSYIGFETRSIKISNNKNLTVSLKEDARTVDEVVVTAMGIKKDRKALGYAVTDLKANELMKNKNRSEERRVGKECRSRRSPYH